MKRIGTFVIAVALMAGMVGCGEVIDNGDANGNGNGAVSYQLTVSSTSGGSVVEPGEGVHTYEDGTVVELEAVADDGYRFVNWTGDVAKVADVNAESTTVTMNGNYSITASFVAVYDLSISSTAGGSVTTPGEGTFTYDAGAVVGLVATPARGFQLANWTGDVDTVANANAPLTTVTMNGDYSITANFEEEVPVVFVCPNLEAVIREVTDVSQGLIYPSDLKWLTWLSAESANISDLTGLEYCVNLQGLNLYHNHIGDLSPLANLTELRYLYIHNSQISDVSPLANLANLTGLDLYRNQISDISPLANLIHLTRLDLGENQISDISPLANLTNLTNLGLYGNQISDISSLTNLTGLTLLSLGANPLSDISLLADFAGLTWVNLLYCRISDISPLAALTKLTDLLLGYNQITDISPLANLTKLTFLDLQGNQISDISILSDLTSLEWLWLTRNRISDISPLANLTSLTSLSLGSNQISDISALAGLTNLYWLSLGSNQVSDIKPLVDNSGLREGDEVWLSGNPLSEQSINEYIPALQARGVTVDY